MDEGREGGREGGGEGGGEGGSERDPSTPARGNHAPFGFTLSAQLARQPSTRLRIRQGSLLGSSPSGRTATCLTTLALPAAGNSGEIGAPVSARTTDPTAIVSFFLPGVRPKWKRFLEEGLGKVQFIRYLIKLRRRRGCDVRWRVWGIKTLILKVILFRPGQAAAAASVHALGRGIGNGWLTTRDLGVLPACTRHSTWEGFNVKTKSASKGAEPSG
ncbi:hypothetical protein Naga_100129g4 [Nannochloropsis gaditana]|uniref:Uncharacterized protein n=1 Tax=Nannochloropsis gaditana TaxID=72520 RepID=W7TX35_9STRA|nr:hypothetical protein Naga_100129g4 [Nannochloropsis gaditana]